MATKLNIEGGMVMGIVDEVDLDFGVVTGRSNVTSVVVPPGVHAIDGVVFLQCRDLTSLTLPETLRSIGPSSFLRCSGLTSLAFPSSLTSIGVNAFADCSSLTSLTLPENLTSVGSNAFAYCTSLTSVSLPHALTTVGVRCFCGCKNLSSVAFRPPPSRAAFIAWAVGSSRNRANWQLTTLKQSHNILCLIMTLALERRDVASLDPDDLLEPFCNCSFSIVR